MTDYCIEVLSFPRNVYSPRPSNSATSATSETTYRGQIPSNNVPSSSNTVYPSFPGSYQAAPSLGSRGQQGTAHCNRSYYLHLPKPLTCITASYQAPYPPSGSSTSYQASAPIPQQGLLNPAPQQPDPIPGRVRGRKYQPGQGVFQAAVSSSSAASSSSQPPQPPVQGRFSVNPPPTIACSCNIQFDSQSRRTRHWQFSCPDNPSLTTYVCDVCGVQIGRKDNLRRHRKSHQAT